jgi:hypothetical protein
MFLAFERPWAMYENVASGSDSVPSDMCICASHASQVADVKGSYRSFLARNASITFAATVGHICAAVRRLAAVTTPEEACIPLFRGMRGKLDQQFWVPDEQGIVSATDNGFFSTCRSRQVGIQYMSRASPNVLWRILQKPESDGGYHAGADISMLSQNPAEGEVTFGVPHHTRPSLVARSSCRL